MKILIMGASSGIGAELARIYLSQGHEVACAARSVDKIGSCTAKAAIDVTSPPAPGLLKELIGQLGGMDLYIHVAGIGYDNPSLLPDRDAAIAETNCVGFARMISTAFNWFAACGHRGHIAAITSVAGTKGIGGMEAYSASKHFDWTYLQGLRQRAVTSRLPIDITDIRPGWTRTPLLKQSQRYPLLMDPQKVCRAIVRAIARRRRHAVINRRWALLQILWHLIPDSLWQHLSVKS